MPIDQPPSTGANTARLFFSLGVMSIGVAGALATVLGFFGGTWWAFDILAGYRLQLAVILLIVAAGFRIGFGMATGALFLAAALTNLVIVLPLFTGGRAEAAAESGTLTVASVPVEETGREEAMTWVVESGVDIAFLLDTDDTWTGARPESGSGYTTVDQVFVGRQTGITVVARNGLDIEVTGFDNTNRPVVRAGTTLGGRDVAIYALILPAPGSNTEAEQREVLLDRVRDAVASESVPVAVIGDLGVSQWSHSFRMLTGDDLLEDSSPGNGFQGSTPGNLWIGLRVPTQHLLHTSDMTVTGRHVGPDLGHGRAVFEGTLAFATG